MLSTHLEPELVKKFFVVVFELVISPIPFSTQYHLPSKS